MKHSQQIVLYIEVIIASLMNGCCYASSNCSL